MDADFLKQLDEKFEEREKQNLENLGALIKETAQVFEVKVGGVVFKCYEPPASMIKDIEKLNIVEFAEEYFPILFGIPKEQVEKLPISVMSAMIYTYIQEYSKMVKDISFLDRMGKK